MSLLRPKGARQTWYYDITVNGRRVCKGGFPTKTKALAAQEEKRKELKTGKQAPTDTVYFSQVANEYLDYCSRKFIRKTYLYKASVFRSFISLAGDLPIQQVGLSVLESYLSTRPGNVNYNRHRKEICSLLMWAWRRRYLADNPCLWLEKMPEEPYKRQIPTQEDMAKIFLASGEYRSFFVALYALAARVGEINRLRWEDVNFEKRLVTLWTRKRTGIWRPQVKAMNEDLFNELTRIYGKRSGEWVFPNPETGLPYIDRRKQLQRICRLAGVVYCGFHAIRHHVASLLADIYKVSLPTLQKLLGHSRMTTTEKYIHSLTEGEREAADFLKFESTHANSHANGKKGGGDEGI